MKTEELKGIPVSPGVTIGTAFIFHRQESFTIPYVKIKKSDIPTEIAHFEDAITRTRAEILGIRKNLSVQIGREHSDIFNAHLLILEDRTLIEDVIALIKTKTTTADHAFSLVVQRYFRAFSQINDEYLKERVDDIKDVSRRLLHNLHGDKKNQLENLSEKVVLIAHDLSPSDTATMDKEKVLAFVTEVGGPTSHTAILGRSLEIPAIVGMAGVTGRVKTGDPIIVDGTHGVLIINPDRKLIQEYEKQEERYSELTTELHKLKDLPAETTDGKKITLASNIEFDDEISSVLSHGSEGIGLYRTEYLYMNRQDLPTEEEQYRAYKNAAKKIAPHPFIIRTLDLGGDKFISSLDVPREMNPFLGWRAIRFCLTQVDVFKEQLRAVLRASTQKNLKLMYPMISNVHELRHANAILEECKLELKSKKQRFNPDLEIGAMIEIPSAAVTSDILAKEVDFFSIGSNDLIQYALAVDRVNEKIAYLYEPTHPAILRLIQQVIQNGHKQKIWIGCCGEMAADPAIAVLLVGLGVDELSISPFILPKAKKAIRSVSYEFAQEIAGEALKFETGKEVREFITAKMKRVCPDLIE
ncbi:MAG: phosphoenolpyruvate--protein phosphotransferase [Candidatus Omnitrophica bacterium]|nr:phosphoenolpyruvate--protein phosphotransferase [Candidatus Omnitrophota bacterium]